MAGVTCWNYFAETLNKTSETFTVNAQIFGKVYFPRVIVPLSIVLSNLLKFGVQFLMFLVIWGYFLTVGKPIQPNWAMLLLPVLICLMAGIGLGLGMIISSLTTKYRDLRFLLQFGVQLAMYATPVIYPMSTIPAKYAGYVASNPITPLVETFRYGWLGQGQFSWMGLAYSGAFCVIIVFLGMLIFNRVEKTFMDTV
jgi:lipopolysaccharide transport system permease protein